MIETSLELGAHDPHGALWLGMVEATNIHHTKNT